MTPADEQVLALLTPFMSDLGAEHVREAVTKAGGIRQLTDATAIAELEVAKRKFSSRSAAGEYAANVRWRGSRPEYLSPGAKGEKARTATLGTKMAQFEVTPIRASQVKIGDIVSSGSDRRPKKVVEIFPGKSRTEMRMRDIDETGGPRQSTTWVLPNASMRLWTVLEVEKAERRSFGSRSEAGRYAAQIRWGKTLQTGLAPITGGKTDEILGAGEIRDLVVDYSQPPGRRMKTTNGLFVAYEQKYVEARKVKQDYEDEVSRIVSSMSELSRDEKELVMKKTKVVSKGFTRAANDIGHLGTLDPVNTGMSSSGYIRDQLGGLWMRGGAVGLMVDQIAQETSRSFLAMKAIAGL